MSNAAAKHGDTAPAIELKGVHKSFGDRVVLEGVALSVNAGEAVAILGKSGTGKSVLLRLLVRLEHPDSGSICILGSEIESLDTRRLNALRLKIGYLFQSAALYDSLTLEENVAFPLVHSTAMSAGQRAKRVRALLERVGLENDANKMPGEISGGMKKRVGLARALVLDPDILLFDEPTAGLDPITAAEIDTLIVELQRENRLTVIAVTHDIRGARTVAQRLVLLRDGKVLIEGSYEQLLECQDEFVSQFLRSN